MADKPNKVPERIRVAQDADGFWTCREAVSGSKEFIRADIAEQMAEATAAIVEFCDDPDGSEKPETLAEGLARLLPGARAALSSYRKGSSDDR